jgi:hypothetical protein
MTASLSPAQKSPSQQSAPKSHSERGVRVLAQELIRCPRAGYRLLFKPGALLLEPFQPRPEFSSLFLRQMNTGRLGKLIRALHHPHQIINQPFQRTLSGNEIFVV